MTSSGPAGRLLPGERQRLIRQLARERSIVRVADLAHEFGVSEMTIRRDLDSLARSGHLEKTFGGAVMADQAGIELSYKIRLQTNQRQKQAIAERAAHRVQEKSTVAIDASTTGLALARTLVARELTVVTNSLDIAQELRAAKPSVILVGGSLRQTSGSFVGPLTLAALGHLRVDQTFFSCKGVVVPDGFMESDLDETEVKRQLLACAACVTALVDSSKFGKRALACIATLDRAGTLITDQGASKEVLAELEAWGVKTCVAEVTA